MSAEGQPPDFCARAAACLRALREGTPWEAHAEVLALAAAAPDTAVDASTALFRDVVEPLADSFDPDQARAYSAFFRFVLETVRPAPGFEDIDEALRERGRIDPAGPLELDKVRRVVVLSRVTLGADIAVSSVFLRAALDLPSAPEVWFAAGPKNLALFSGEARVRPMEISYPRGGTLRERLEVWLQAQRAIGEASRELEPGELLLLDPDSRITQLGLLPVAAAEQQHAFFDSRSFREGEPGPLAALSAEWLEGRLRADEEPPLPWLALPPDDVARARSLCSGLAGRVAAVNFGVGGNASKRVGDPFEAAAIGLLEKRGYSVVIDAGAGEEELARAQRLARRGTRMLHQGSFTSFAAVIAQSDLFVGYDSGAAHAAAALGVRAIDVFAGAPSETMRSRWSPWGKRPGLVLAVDEDEAPDNVLWRLRELLG